MNGAREDGALSRVAVVVAACCALPYIGSKIAFALEGRLGVHGGPRVTRADYASFNGPDDIAAAQWGNVAAGVLILLITLLPRAPFARRWNRWVGAVLLALVGSGLLAGGLTMLIRGVVVGVGGGVFGNYLLIWSAAVWLLTVAHLLDLRMAKESS